MAADGSLCAAIGDTVKVRAPGCCAGARGLLRPIANRVNGLAAIPKHKPNE